MQAVRLRRAVLQPGGSVGLEAGDPPAHRLGAHAHRLGRRGRPRRRPDKLRADKAYDAKARRQECRTRGIVPRIARKGVESSERLGRHRLVVERTHAWFNRFRRLPIRYERRADIYQAFTSLAASLVTLNQIRRFC